MSLPGIAYVRGASGGPHFVVLERLGRRKVSVFDPAVGEVRELSRADFESGFLNVVLQAKPLPAFANLAEASTPWSLFRRLLVAERHLVGAAMAAGALAGILSFSASIYLRVIADYVLPYDNMALLRLATAAMAMVFVLRLSLQCGQSSLLNRAAHNWRAPPFSAVAPAGRITAIYGRTDLSLLCMRTLRSTRHIRAGEVMLNDVDIRMYRAAELDEAIGWAPLDARLFSGTVWNNVTGGRDCPDTDRIIGICRRLGILGAVQSLPQGWSTSVGGGGIIFQPNERRLLTIARALGISDRLVCLENPTLNLNRHERASLLAAIRAWLADGGTAIVATDDRELAEACDACVAVADAARRPEEAATDRRHAPCDSPAPCAGKI